MAMFDFLKKDEEVFYGILVYSEGNNVKTNNRRHHDGHLLVYRDGQIEEHDQDIGTDPMLRNPGDYFTLHIRFNRLRVKDRVPASEVPNEQMEALRAEYQKAKKIHEDQQLREELDKRANTKHVSFGLKGISVSDEGPGLDESMNLAGIEDNTLPERERNTSKGNRTMVKLAKLATKKVDSETDRYGHETFGIVLNAHEHAVEFLVIEPSGRIWCYTELFEEAYSYRRGDYVLVKHYKNDINVIGTVGFDDMPEKERKQLHEAMETWLQKGSP